MRSGRQIFSLVIPSVNFEKKIKVSNNEPNFKNNVVIEKGIVKSGTFDKNILGSSEQGLIHTIFNDYGKKRTQQFLDDIQNIVTNFVLKSGFSVGIGDLIPDKESRQNMKKIVTEKKDKLLNLLNTLTKVF